MLNYLTILFGKLLIFLSNILNLGSGSTWPGHISLKINPNLIGQVLKNSRTKVIIIAGTNGKTTTGRLVTSIIREHKKTYLQNKAGANLISGLASTLIKGVSLFSLPRRDPGRLTADYLIFESDEYALPEVIEQTNPDYIICLNLFRDQLDRYGEIDSISKKWRSSFEKLSNKTTLILNADDPQIAYLSKNSKARAFYFGLDQKGQNGTKHGADSIYCPRCSSKLDFNEVHFSHLGIWKCPKCNLKRPTPTTSNIDKYPLVGTYNKYNAKAAFLFAKQEGIDTKVIDTAFKTFTPAFGRQELIYYEGKKIQLFLSKNPTSFNESLLTIKELGGKNLLILLNDRIPDGLDVSWIWDINFEDILEKDINIMVSGERVYDMALRLKYAEQFTHVEPSFKNAINQMIGKLETDETLYVLPNYSAMLDARKILTGKKIL